MTVAGRWSPRSAEKISVRRFERVTSTSQLGSYLHGTRIGTLVAVQGGDAALARDLAMHIARHQPAASGCLAGTRGGHRQGALDPH